MEYANDPERNGAAPHTPKSFTVIWNEQAVGQLLHARPDMWYLEGSWQPKDSAEARTFEGLCRRLVVRDVYRDWALGVRVTLLDAARQVQEAVVLGLDENLLFVRNISPATAASL